MSKHLQLINKEKRSEHAIFMYSKCINAFKQCNRLGRLAIYVKTILTKGKKKTLKQVILQNIRATTCVNATIKVQKYSVAHGKSRPVNLSNLTNPSALQL